MSTAPIIFVCVVAGTFLLMIATFFVYDWLVQRRNRNLVLNAAQSNAIVTSMFPGSLREKVVAQNRNDQNRNEKATRGNVVSKMKSLLADGESSEDIGFLGFDSSPLAELYLETSIMFADVVGKFSRLGALYPPHFADLPHHYQDSLLGALSVNQLKCLLYSKLYTLHSMPLQSGVKFSRLRLLVIAM